MVPYKNYELRPIGSGCIDVLGRQASQEPRRQLFGEAGTRSCPAARTRRFSGLSRSVAVPPNAHPALFARVAGCTPLAGQNHRSLGLPAPFVARFLGFPCCPKHFRARAGPRRSRPLYGLLTARRGPKRTGCLSACNPKDNANGLKTKRQKRPISSRPTDCNPWTVMPTGETGAGPRRSRPLYGLKPHGRSNKDLTPLGQRPKGQSLRAGNQKTKSPIGSEPTDHNP